MNQKPYPHQQNHQIFPAACPHDCPSTCALEIELLDSGKIGRVHGSRRNPYTAGVICAKVARYAERHHHPDRLKTPLRRIGPKGSNKFKAIGWEEALDEIAETFLRIEQEWGAEAIWPYYYAGTMGMVQRDGINRLRHEKKYSQQKGTICTALSDAGWRAGVGALRGIDSRELEEADLILIWGTNAVATQVNVMTHVAKARKARGAKLVVIDPYRNATAEQADLHIMPRPGTDGALAVAMMHVLFAEGMADWDYMRNYADDPDSLANHVQKRPPEWAEKITGIPAQKIKEFARLYGSTKRSFLRLGYGFCRSRNGAANMHAVSCLPAVTGAWAHPGGGALYVQGDLYPLDRRLITGADLLDPRTRMMDMSRIGPVLCGDPNDLGDGPPVKAILIQNTNPMAVAPESLKVKEGFQREDLFTVVHEQFMTETALMADIVLPAPTFLEYDDFYKAAAHSYLQVVKKIAEPYAQSRSNHEVIVALAKRLGCQHPGFSLNAWQLIEKCLEESGLPSAEDIYQKGGHDCALSFEQMHFLNGFAHRDKKFHFKADWAAIGMEHKDLPALPDHCAVMDAANHEKPFRLITAPARHFLNSSFTETPTSRAKEGRPTLMIHSADAEDISLADGAIAKVGNDRASIRLHCRHFDGMQRGIVIIESVWPNHCFIDGLGVNALTSADPGLPAGGAVFHDTSVWVRS